MHIEQTINHQRLGAGAGENDYRSQFQSPKPTAKSRVTKIPPFVNISAHALDAYIAYYKTPQNGDSSLPEREEDFRSHFQSTKPTDIPEGINLPYMTGSSGDLYGPYYSPRIGGGGYESSMGEIAFRSHYQSPRRTDKSAATIAKTRRIFDAVGDKISVGRDVVKAPDLLISRIEPRDFDSLVNSKVEIIPCNSTTDYFTNETECQNSTQEKTEKTLFLRGNHSGETNVYPVATSRNGPLIVNHLYGYQPYLDPAYQYIYPVLLGTCIGTTLILVIVLIKQFQTASGMSRASISILMAIAVSDALTTGFGLSEVCYRFSETSGNPGFLPYRSCNTMFIIGHLSGVVHEASVWLTVVLTTQRFICVSRPFFARRRINLRVSMISIAAIFAVILSFHIYRFFDRSFVKVVLQQSNILHEENFETCDLVYASWIENPAKYESIFLWLLIVLMQFLPCIIIATFVSLIVKPLIKKKTNLVTSETARSQRVQITIIVIVIAIIAVSVELSSGIFLSLCVWGTTTGEFLFSYDTMKSVAVAFDLVLYVSYFVIFLIYCLMSQEVRRVIVAFCTMGRGRKAGKSSTSDFV